MGYFIVINGQQHGPFEPNELTARGARAESLVWAEGMPDWQRAADVQELRHLFSGSAAPTIAPPPPPPPHQQQPQYQPNAPPQHAGAMSYQPAPGATYSSAASNRIAAGICAILIGWAGVHKFILGYTQAGVIMLCVTLLTCGVGGIVMSVIGIVEGITYLTKTDEEFYQTYVARRKEWF